MIGDLFFWFRSEFEVTDDTSETMKSIVKNGFALHWENSWSNFAWSFIFRVELY